jgi:hypothetical protein
MPSTPTFELWWTGNDTESSDRYCSIPLSPKSWSVFKLSQGCGSFPVGWRPTLVPPHLYLVAKLLRTVRWGHAVGWAIMWNVANRRGCGAPWQAIILSHRIVHAIKDNMPLSRGGGGLRSLGLMTYTSVEGSGPWRAEPFVGKSATVGSHLVLGRSWWLCLFEWWSCYIRRWWDMLQCWSARLQCWSARC